MSAQPPAADGSHHRLVLWNIGLTLLDVARVNRAAYAEAFRAVNATGPSPGDPVGEELLGRFAVQLATAFRARRNLLTTQGQLMPGALEAVTAVWRLPGLVQTVVTGSIRPNAIEVLRAFGLDRYLDTEIGGFGSEVYPKGAMLLNARGRAAEKYRAGFTEHTTVYIADSTRDVEAAGIGGCRSIGVASGR